jgi:hypothetical protein
MLRAWVPVNEIFHVHPAAWTGSPQVNLLPFGVDNVTATDTKELHLVLSVIPVCCLWTDVLFRRGCGSVSRERRRAGKSGELEKLAPWLQISCFSFHKTSLKHLVCLVSGHWFWRFTAPRKESKENWKSTRQAKAKNPLLAVNPRSGPRLSFGYLRCALNSVLIDHRF